MGNLDIVITMGGLGSRFRKAGYQLPKYMIEAKGKTLFEWSMISLEGYADTADRYIFIALKDEGVDVESFIRAKCSELSLPEYEIILLDELTAGQAATAVCAEPYWDPDHALLIYNIDTYVEPGAMHSRELRGDGFIPCFEAEGDHWSFVRLDEQGRVVEIKEKQRISSHCTLGAYYFKSCRFYRELYDEFYGSEDLLVEENSFAEEKPHVEGEQNSAGEQKSACKSSTAGEQKSACKSSTAGEQKSATKSGTAGEQKSVCKSSTAGEQYVAPLYDYLLSKGGEIYISDVAPEQVHVLGTPEELQAFLNEADC